MAETRNTSSSSGPSRAKEAADEIVPVRTVTRDENGRAILREEDVFEVTAYAWSNKKKWVVLSVVALCQTSMNYNAAVYSNAVEHLNHEYGITNARMGMVAFLVTYAFGCELWAPWSEELGRFPIMQLSLGLVNLTQLLPALSKNWTTVLTGRVLGGLFSAGGSVTLGMVADMFEPEDQQHAVLWASLWSCLGSVIGGICGGPIEQYLPWRWNFWIQLIFGGVVQAIHFFLCRETRSTSLVNKEAKRRRKNGEEVYGPGELKTFSERFPLKHVLTTFMRPFVMFLTEPIVLFLSLLSGFSDALIFSFLESYGYVYGEGSWDFSKTQFGLAMIPLLIGYVLAYFSFFPVVARHAHRRRNGEILAPESRLCWLLFQVLLLPIGLLGSAFVVTGPPLPWIAPLIFSVLIGMANYSIYYATIDYMVASYGVYSASATGGNGFARDFLAGMCALYTGPMYKKLKPQKSTFLLFGISVAVCVPVYVFYWFGPAIRARSKFAQKLAQDKEERAAMKDGARQDNAIGEEHSQQAGNATQV